MCRRDEVGAVVGALVSPLTFSHIPPPPAPQVGNLCSEPAGLAPALCAERSPGTHISQMGGPVGID